jgi:citrate lyase subunit beta / citryl-CoA lyase
VSSERPDRPALRSLLFVPGTRTEWLPKAAAAGADAVIFDLEDAVPPQRRAEAGERVATAVREAAGGPAVFVRINPLDCWEAADELRGVLGPNLAGVVLPKVDDVRDVELADHLITFGERRHGLPHGAIALIPLLETANALRSAYPIATAVPRVEYLGAVTAPGGDVESAIGYRWTPGGTETAELRSRVLLDARAAGIRHPVGGLWTRVGDLDGLRAYALHTRALGYTGMMAIHPSHVPVINEVFTTGPEELARLGRLLEAYERGTAAGHGAVVFEGDMVDEAMAARARRRLRDSHATPGLR